MTPYASRLAGGLVAVLLLASAAPAQKDKPTVAGVRLGTPVCGPVLSADDLKGSAVVFDYWGVNCAPCLLAMPKLAALHAELADYGLVVIGNHCQSASKDVIKEKALSRGAQFAITDGGGVRGSTGEGLPRSILFDHTGAAVFEGLPGELETKVRPVLGAAIVAGSGRDTFPKALAPVVDVLKKGQSPKLALPKLVPLLKAGDKETAEAAKALVDSLCKVADKALDAADPSNNPVAAYDTATRFAATFKGTPAGAKATDLLAKVKTDKTVQAELRARPSLDTVRRGDAALMQAAKAKGVDPTAAEFTKAFGPQIKALGTTLKAMKKAWPDAPATKEAEEIVARYGSAGG